MIKAIYVLIILFAFQIGNAQSLESSLKEGIKQYELGRYYNAIPEFDRAIQSNPNNIYAYIYRSLSKINTIGYKDEAYSDLMIAKELDNELASKIINKIGIERFNDIEKAAQECQFIATNSDNPRRDVINGSCYFQRGMNFYNNADYSKAIDNFEGAIIHPDLKAKAFYYVGKSYIGLGKQQLRTKGDEKYACDRFRFSFTDGFKKAIELDSTNIKYYLGANEAKILEYQNCSVNTLSIVHLRLNYMNKILEINPNHEFAIQTKNELLISLKNEEEKERLKKIADAKQAIADAKQAKINEANGKKADAERIKNNKIFKSKVEVGDHVTVTRPDIGWMSGRITSVTKNGFEMDVAKAGNLYGEVTKYDKNLRWIPWLGTNDAILEFGSK